MKSTTEKKQDLQAIFSNIQFYNTGTPLPEFKKEAQDLVKFLFVASDDNHRNVIDFLREKKFIPNTKNWRNRPLNMLKTLTEDRVPRLSEFPIEEVHAYEATSVTGYRNIEFTITYKQPILLELIPCLDFDINNAVQCSVLFSRVHALQHKEIIITVAKTKGGISCLYDTYGKLDDTQFPSQYYENGLPAKQQQGAAS